MRCNVPTNRLNMYRPNLDRRCHVEHEIDSLIRFSLSDATLKNPQADDSMLRKNSVNVSGFSSDLAVLRKPTRLLIIAKALL